MRPRHTRTENVSSHFLLCDKALRVGIRDIPLELGFANHLSQARSSQRVPKKVLGEKVDELQTCHFPPKPAKETEGTDRFAEVAIHLPPEYVELGSRQLAPSSLKVRTTYVIRWRSAATVR
jgi:hypothetical protein